MLDYSGSQGKIINFFGKSDIRIGCKFLYYLLINTHISNDINVYYVHMLQLTSY